MSAILVQNSTHVISHLHGRELQLKTMMASLQNYADMQRHHMSIIFNLSSACTDLYWREAEAFVERSKDRHGNTEEEPEPAKGLASQCRDVLRPLQPTDVPHCHT